MSKVYNVLVLRQKEIFEKYSMGGCRGVFPKVREDNTGLSHRAWKRPPPLPPPSLPVSFYLIRAAAGKG